MEVRYQEHNWILDSKTLCMFVNESRPKGNNIRSSWGLAYEAGGGDPGIQSVTRVSRGGRHETGGQGNQVHSL